MSDPQYVALIGDLVGSSALEEAERATVQSLLEARLAELNERLGGEHLASPLVLVSGDEVQGLLRRPQRAVEVLQELSDLAQDGSQEAADPPDQAIAFGLGRGGLSTGELPPAPRQAPHPGRLDGPCFHRAREALELSRRKYKCWATARGFGARDDTLSSLLELMGALRARWAPGQARTVYLARHWSGTRKELAVHLGVSPSVVSESLSGASYEALRRAEEVAARLLADDDPGGAA